MDLQRYTDSVCSWSSSHKPTRTIGCTEESRGGPDLPGMCKAAACRLVFFVFFALLRSSLAAFSHRVGSSQSCVEKSQVCSCGRVCGCVVVGACPDMTACACAVCFCSRFDEMCQNLSVRESCAPPMVLTMFVLVSGMIKSSLQSGEYVRLHMW